MGIDMSARLPRAHKVHMVATVARNAKSSIGPKFAVRFPFAGGSKSIMVSSVAKHVSRI
jgi:hypothetical protein